MVILMVDNPIIHFIWSNTSWLYKDIFVYKWFYFDLWSFVHMWSGALILISLTVLHVKKRWLKLLLILVGYEAVENPVLIVIMQVFKPEKVIDVFNDILVGMAGGVLIYLLFHNFRRKRDAVRIATILAAVTISFFWSGWYGSIYMKSDYLEILSLASWSIWGLIIIFVFNFCFFKQRVDGRRKAALPAFFSVMAVIFLTSLPAVSLTATQLNNVGLDVSSAVFLYYAIAPLLFLGLYKLLEKLFTSYVALQYKEL